MPKTLQKTEKLERLIETATLEAQQSPWAYRLKLALLALRGYVVVHGILLLVVSLLTVISWAIWTNGPTVQLDTKHIIILALLPLTYVLIRGLRVKIDTPAPLGLTLNPDDFPALFKELKLAHGALRVPVVHQVILTANADAEILRTPRLGLFGWNKNTLIIGLELLISMTHQQARSVVIHELSHFSTKHDRFQGKIYGLRQHWLRIRDGLAQPNSVGTKLMRRFFAWYAPTFAAYSFPLARAKEYAADAFAANITSKADTAQALVVKDVIHDLLNEQFWQVMMKQADDSTQPPASPYGELLPFLKDNRFEIHAVNHHIGRAMAIPTGHRDTHPSLSDRLNALECEPRPLERVKKSAAKFWLGDKMPTIIQDFDNLWLRNNSGKWRDRYHHAQNGRAKLADLKAKVQDKPLEHLSPQELLQLATMTEAFAPEEDSLPLYELYLKKQSRDNKALFAVGCLLLERNDESGVEKLKLVMDRQPNLKTEILDKLVYFYRCREDAFAIAFWQQRANRQHDINKAAEKEREVIASQDEILKPDMQKDIFNLFTTRITGVEGLKHAWLAEKRMRYDLESKTYLLAIDKGFFANADNILNQVVSRLDANINCYVLLKGGDHPDIAMQVVGKGVELF